MLERPTHEELEGKEAFQEEQAIRQTIQRMRHEWVVLAGQLYHFHQHERWKDLGIPTFMEWLQGPEIDLEWRTVYTLLQVYKEFIERRHLPIERLGPIPVSKLHVVVSAVAKNRLSVDEALADAESLSRTDLREKYQGLSVIEDRLSEGTRDMAFYTCPTCGSSVRRRA